jgi:hypothetical protein
MTAQQYCQPVKKDDLEEIKQEVLKEIKLAAYSEQFSEIRGLEVSAHVSKSHQHYNWASQAPLSALSGPVTTVSVYAQEPCSQRMQSNIPRQDLETHFGLGLGLLLRSWASKPSTGVTDAWRFWAWLSSSHPRIMYTLAEQLQLYMSHGIADQTQLQLFQVFVRDRISEVLQETTYGSWAPAVGKLQTSVQQPDQNGHSALHPQDRPITY